VDGLVLTFHLAGINNQNFLMRDEQTGTYWQQISGLAISGPLAGLSLPLIHSDELTLGLWKTEQPRGMVFKDVAAYVSQYAKPDWDVKMKRAPTVLSYARPGLAPRDTMLGIHHASGAARAFPYETVLKQKLIKDFVGPQPVVLVVGPDDRSVRAFMPQDADFYREIDPATPGSLMMDSRTGSRWNFQGCAIDGKSKGSCLVPVEVIKDYWFDWRHYNPATSVYGLPVEAR
jgi:hypothetical protein